MRPPPGRLVLLGHPVRQSLSPTFQNAALRRISSPLVYEALDVAPQELTATIRALAAVRGAGNVTIPHKPAAAAACDRLTPLAERIGAVNTFWTEDGVLVGDNTDAPGFDRAARALLGREPAGLRVALLGAGGSAAAVLAAAEAWTGCSVAVWSRTAERAAALAERFPGVAHSAELMADALRGADLVVNATPIGLGDDERIPVPPALVRRSAAVFDLVYRRGETTWVRLARSLGRRACDGLPMLIEQGALSFERWFGVEPDREAMWESVGGRPSPRPAGSAAGAATE
jgi:shikimate dehydrogenase